MATGQATRGASSVHQDKKIDKKSACPNCLRPKQQCICGRVNPVKNRIPVLILQYPREQYRLLNSAKLTSMVLTNSVLRVGLSWRNLSKAYGSADDTAQWGVLYLGSGARGEEIVQVLDRKKRPILPRPRIAGIVVLDG